MNKKKTKRIFTKVHSIKDFLTVLESHEDKTVFKYLEGREYKSVSYAQFVDRVKCQAQGFINMGYPSFLTALSASSSILSLLYLSTRI